MTWLQRTEKGRSCHVRVLGPGIAQSPACQSAADSKSRTYTHFESAAAWRWKGSFSTRMMRLNEMHEPSSGCIVGICISLRRMAAVGRRDGAHAIRCSRNTYAIVTFSACSITSDILL